MSHFDEGLVVTEIHSHMHIRGTRPDPTPRGEVNTMCIKCDVNNAVNAGDWDEVARLAREEKKATKAAEADEAPAAGDEKASSGKASKS